MDDIHKEKKLLESQNYYRTVEKGHGRFEIRECIISEEISWLHNKSDWKGLYGVGAIYCTIEKDGITSKQSHYFIYSCIGLERVKATPHISRKMIKQKKNTQQIDRVYKKYPILCSQGKPDQTDRDVLSAR